MGIYFCFGGGGATDFLAVGFKIFITVYLKLEQIYGLSLPHISRTGQARSVGAGWDALRYSADNVFPM